MLVRIGTLLWRGTISTVAAVSAALSTEDGATITTESGSLLELDV